MAIINQQNFQIKSGNAWYKLCPFPVGYVYLGYTSTSPASTFGGTWSAMATNRYVRLSNNVTASGSNTISIDNMPSHGHNLNGYYYPIITGWGEGIWFGSSTSGNIGVDQRRMAEKEGGGKEFTPKYQNLYAWRRTA